MSELRKLAEASRNKIKEANLTEGKKYDLSFLFKTIDSFQKGSALLGSAANPLMYMQAAGVDQPIVTEILKKYDIDFEAIIDASVQGEHSCKAAASVDAIMAAFKETLEVGVKYPKQMLSRSPKQFKSDIKCDPDSTISVIHEHLQEVIDDMDIAILGEGSLHGGDRIPGLIDEMQPPMHVVEALYGYIGEIPGWVSKRANQIRGEYGSKTYALMNKTKDMKVDERTEEREIVREYQLDILKQLNTLKVNEVRLIVAKWAADIYVSDSFMHDSVLFIDDMEENGKIYKGTFMYFMEVMQDLGLAKRVHEDNSDAGIFKQILGQEESITKEVKKRAINYNRVRQEIKVWRPKSEGKTTVKTVVGDRLVVEDGVAMVGETILRINEKTPIKDGVYRIDCIDPIYSVKERKEISTGVIIRLK